MRAGPDEYKPAIQRADAWVRGVKPADTPDASAVLFALRAATDEQARTLRTAALEFLKNGQGPDGGWGPYPTVPAEPFDTAIAIVALAEVDRHAHPTFTRDELRRAIERGRAYLARHQEPDASWWKPRDPPARKAARSGSRRPPGRSSRCSRHVG